MIRIKQFLVDNEWTILASLAFLSFSLGTIGAVPYLKSLNLFYNIFDALYIAMKLFFFAFVQQAEIPIPLQIARFVAPLTLWYAAGKTFIVVAHEKISLMKLRQFEKHAIVCGLGTISMNLIKDLIAQNEKVVVIEPNSDNPHIEYCKNNNIIVLVGNPYDRFYLQKARIDKAKYLICFVDDDTNITTSIISYKETKLLKHASDIVCFVHISKLEVLTALTSLNFFGEITKDQIENKKSRRNFELRPFNIYAKAARLIINYFSPDIYANIKPDSPQAHILIIGFNQLGQSILLQAARMGHYANFKKLRISVIDKNINTAKEEFLRLNQQLHQVVDIHFYNNSLVTFNTEEFDKIEANIPIACSYLCLKEDRETSAFLGMLVHLKQYNDKHIVACLNSSDNILSLLPETSKSKIHKFLLFDETCTRDAIINEKIDDLAKAIHNEYLRKQIVSGTLSPKGKESHKEWNILSQNFKDQNRSQADNILVKLRALGCKMKEKTSNFESYDYTKEKDIIELLAKMEHNRWCAHLWVNGWQLGEKRDDARKIHTDLIPYDELSDSIKQYDRDAIINMPNLLDSLGMMIVKQRV